MCPPARGCGRGLEVFLPVPGLEHLHSSTRKKAPKSTFEGQFFLCWACAVCYLPLSLKKFGEFPAQFGNVATCGVAVWDSSKGNRVGARSRAVAGRRTIDNSVRVAKNRKISQENWAHKNDSCTENWGAREGL